MFRVTDLDYTVQQNLGHVLSLGFSSVGLYSLVIKTTETVVSVIRRARRIAHCAHRAERSRTEPSRAKANRTKTETRTLPKQDFSCISVMAVKTLTMPKLESGDSDNQYFRCCGITNQKMFRRKIKPKLAN